MPARSILLDDTFRAVLSAPESRCADRWCPSPNHGERTGGRKPDMIVLHYTGMTDGASALAWLCERRSAVSCHYLVDEDGSVVQLVPEGRRAWHAGLGRWKGDSDLNTVSLGIEVVNGGHEAGLPPFPRPQVDAVIALCRDLVSRRAVRPERIVAHSDVAPGRKQDPGERFPWAELYARGVGHWVPERTVEGPLLVPGDAGPQVAALQAALADYGYGIESTGVYDAGTRTVVEAFQRHFRPSRVDGRADAGTVATLDDLSNALRPGASAARF